MNDVKTFVNRIYKRKFLHWIANKTLFALFLFLLICFFALIFNESFYMTQVEWKIFPLTLLLSLLPFLSGKPNISETVEFLEKQIKEFKGRLYLVMEPYPSALDSELYRKRAIKESAFILKRKVLKELTPIKIDLRYLVFLGSIILMLVVFYLFSGGIRFERISETPVVTYADRKIQENQSFLVLAKSTQLKRMYLFYNDRVKKMVNLGNGKFGIVAKTKKTSEIQVGYRTWKSKDIKLEVIPSLFVSKLILKYQFPNYLGLQSFSDTLYKIEEEILIQALTGTRVYFSGVSNLTLGSIEGAISNKKIDKERFSGSFVLKDKQKISVGLTDSSLFSSYTLNFFIDPIFDEPPRIEFIYPQGEYKLDESMEVPIILRAEDDYSLFSTELVYGKEKIDLVVPKKAKFVEDSIILQVGNLMPGETLKITGIATDLAGNKTLSSPVVIFMPTLEEIFGEYKELSDTLEKHTIGFEETEKELAEKIENFLYKNKLGSKSQDEIKKTLKEQKDLIEGMQKLALIAEKIRSPEVSEELDRIKELLNNSHVKEFLNDLNKMMKKTDISPEELKKLSESQKDLLETLELFKKSLEYLKKLLELNEFSNRAQEIYEKQKELNSSKPNETLSKLERELREELAQLIGDMKKSSDEKIKETALEFKKTNTIEEMEKLADFMKQGELNQESAETIEENLRNLNTSLKAFREYSAGEKLREAIKKKGWELNFILHTHNNLIDKKPGLEKGLSEQGLLEALVRIEKELQSLFLETLAFSPEVFSALTRAKEKMKDLSVELTQKEIPRASMERVNDLIIQAILKLFSTPPPSSESLSSAINQIIQQQNSIMQGLGKILPLEVPTQTLSGELRSLIEKQRQLAEDLRKMGRAFESLSSEMDDMADDLARGKLDQKLIERQRKVLDRLLEAEKAIREGEVSRRRRSKPGIFVSPKKVSIPKNLGEEKKNLRELLEKRIEEPYPEEYKEEVEEYFRKLIE